jgi:tetratricopeptide (TPR) repeat protein
VASKLTILSLAVALPALTLAAVPVEASPQDIGKAITEHRRLADEAPSPGVLNDLANLLVLEGRRDEAESIYRRVLGTDPGNNEAAFNLGLLLQNRGEDEEAETLFLSVVDRQPRHPWALYQLGAIYEGRGERRDAVQSYSKALAIDPELYFADVNPQVVTNGLLTESLLEAARRRGSARMAPMQYSRPREITQMLLSLPAPAVPPAVTEQPEPPATDPPATDPSVTDPPAPDPDGGR